MKRYKMPESLPGEIWKKAPWGKTNWSVRYMVSSIGRVLSPRRKILKQSIVGGYPASGHRKDIGMPRLVHRIVATVFIPNPDNLPCVNHLNGIKSRQPRREPGVVHQKAQHEARRTARARNPADDWGWRSSLRPQAHR